MFNSELLNLRRWGALTCVIALSLVLAACGDDAETNNGTAANNGGVTDTGSSDGGQVDGGPDAGADVGQDAGADGGQDAGADATADAADTSDSDEDASATAIEIAGVYDSNFDSVETITNQSWEVVASWGTSNSAIITYDNTGNWTVTQNADDADFDPSKFNKIVWTEPDTEGSFFYCTVTFGEETAADAENTDQTADSSDPANSGCGGSSWTKLTPQ